MGAGQDGDHHLRHVGPALVPGGDPSGRRAGPRDEPDGRRRAGQGRLHHPSPQQLHGPLQGPSRPQARPGCPQGRQSARGHRRVVQQDPGRGEGRLPDRPVRRRLRRRPAVPPGLALEVAGRRHRDPRRGRDQRLGRRDLEPAREPRHQQRHAHGRAHEYVRARPAVRPAAARPARQERAPRPRPDRHDVQLADVALCQPFRGDQPDHRAYREIRRADDHLDRPDRPAGFPVPARRPPARGLPDRRGRIPDREDACRPSPPRSWSRWASAARSRSPTRSRRTISRESRHSTTPTCWS